MNSFEEKPQWKSGQVVAEFLDSFFSKRGWQIEPTSPYEERTLCRGDRLYYRNEETWYVEYKSGIQTFYTGNVFLETVSIDSQNKPGWVYTCRADAIFYAAVLNKLILVIQPEKLRAEIDNLRVRFKETKTCKGQNATYNTHGLIVPLSYVQTYLTEQIIAVGEAWNEHVLIGMQP